MSLKAGNCLIAPCPVPDIPADPFLSFGYVEFGSTEEATAAMEAMNGQEVAGRSVKLDFAPEKGAGS